MTRDAKLKRWCDNHPQRKGVFIRKDEDGNDIDMCVKCREAYLLNDGREYLECKYCGVLVVSEEDTSAKSTDHPHHRTCPRFQGRYPAVTEVPDGDEREDREDADSWWDDWTTQAQLEA